MEMAATLDKVLESGGSITSGPVTVMTCVEPVKNEPKIALASQQFVDHTPALLEDIDRLTQENENLQSYVKELQAGSTDRLVQELRFKIRQYEQELRKHHD